MSNYYYSVVQIISEVSDEDFLKIATAAISEYVEISNLRIESRVINLVSLLPASYPSPFTPKFDDLTKNLAISTSGYCDSDMYTRYSTVWLNGKGLVSWTDHYSETDKTHTFTELLVGGEEE